MRPIACLLLMLSGAVQAETCPPVPDHAPALDALIGRAQVAETEAEGRQIGSAMWELWTRAPDPRAQELLDRGMQAREEYDYATAIAAFDSLVAYCPEYAEGFNQRAFVLFLRGSHPEALEDLERALERSPRHVAAMAGMALTLIHLGRIEAGQAVLREALALNPWLPERGYLIERR